MISVSRTMLLILVWNPNMSSYRELFRGLSDLSGLWWLSVVLREISLSLLSSRERVWPEWTRWRRLWAIHSLKGVHNCRMRKKLMMKCQAARLLRYWAHNAGIILATPSISTKHAVGKGHSRGAKRTGLEWAGVWSLGVCVKWADESGHEGESTCCTSNKRRASPVFRITVVPSEHIANSRLVLVIINHPLKINIK